MNSAINLIPPDIVPKGKLVKIGDVVKKVSVGLFAIFLVLVLGLVGIFVYNTINIKNEVAKEDQLKNSIKSLEATEQKFVLVKDRIAYAGSILGKESSEREVLKLQELTLGLSDASFTQGDVSAGKSDLTFVVTSISGLKGLLAKLKGSGLYENVIINSFSFNPSLGYSLNIVAFKK